MPDGAITVKRSLDRIAKVIVGVIQHLQLMDATAKKFGRKSAQLNQNPFETDLLSKQLRIAEQFAQELKEIAPKIDQLATELKESCASLQHGFENYPSFDVIEDMSELETVQHYVKILRESKDDLIGTIEELENIRDMMMEFRDFLQQYFGEIQVIDRPLHNATTALNSLILELKHFDAVSTAIIDHFLIR